MKKTLLYCLIGLAVGIALVLRDRRYWLLLVAIPFWPLLAPFLLASNKQQQAPPVQHRPADARIERVQEEVLRAMAGLEGLAEEVLAPEVTRIRDLASAMTAMSRRIAEMEALLATPQFAHDAAEAQLRELTARGVAEDDARVQSVRARLRNVERLRTLRDRTRADLERILLKLEEMASQLHVLKFAGRPEGELLSAIKQIADGVESIAEGLFAEEQPAMN